MAEPTRAHPLVPSFLDRLLGADPPTEFELERSRSRLIRDLKERIQRDLQYLLNTRWRCGPIPNDLDQLPYSLVRYGIPDFAGASMGSMGSRDEFLYLIQTAITRFEPRLRHPKVIHVESKTSGDRILRFRIEALLVLEEDSEPVAFLSQMEPTSGSFQVSGE